MAVTYYGPGEHPAGFVGFRVTAEFNGDLQRLFGTSSAEVQEDADVLFLARRLEAQLQDLEWQRDSLRYRYQRFVSEDHAKTLPERGVGAHGITAEFVRRGRGAWRACFKVAKYSTAADCRQTANIFPFSGPFSDVWEEAVGFWAEEHGVRSADKQRLLNSPPDPEQFKRLRRQMNEHEGHDIPVEALSPVFAEQRHLLARQRAELKAKQMKLHVGVPSPVSTDIQAEMAAWFESVTRAHQR